MRFDDPIAIDVEASSGLPSEQFDGIAQAIEAEVRGQMQVRVRVTVLPPGALPKSAYKNSLLAVRQEI